jgi:Domain of unknown function (DUF4112)
MSEPEHIPVAEIIPPDEAARRAKLKSKTEGRRTVPLNTPPPDGQRPPGGDGIGGLGGIGGLPKVLWSTAIARLLDSAFTIPGTKIRIGLDTLLAAIPIPGVGEVASSSMGATILLEALRNRAPVKILIRMAANLLVNAVLDAIPFVGPVLTIWFRSNKRNHEMLRHYVDGHGVTPASIQSKVLLLMVGLMVASAVTINLLIWKAIYGYLKATGWI